MKPHKHAKLIKAWADGKQIQFRRVGSSKWVDWVIKLGPAWYEDNEYRIKPEPWMQKLVDAVKAGKQVQYFDGFDEWRRSGLHDNPDVSYFGYKDKQEHFRIKPEPKPDVDLYAQV